MKITDPIGDMITRIRNGIEDVFQNWKPRERFEVFKIK